MIMNMSGCGHRFIDPFRCKHVARGGVHEKRASAAAELGFVNINAACSLLAIDQLHAKHGMMNFQACPEWPPSLPGLPGGLVC